MTEIENKVKKYLKIGLGLSSAKTASCPSEETLLDYMEQKLSGQELTLVEEHIAGCGFCLSQLSLAFEAENIVNKKAFPELPEELIKKIKNLIKGDKKTMAIDAAKRRSMKRNLFLIATIIFFILSFIIHKYFMQFLVAALILGFRWAFESESGRTLIMVLDSWRKRSHYDDDEISERLKDRFSKRDL